MANINANLISHLQELNPNIDWSQIESYEFDLQAETFSLEPALNSEYIFSAPMKFTYKIVARITN
jgi:hypothetical protein